MNRKVIISLADSTYYKMLIELINSIRLFKESSSEDICILDAGLTKNELDELSTKVNEIKKVHHSKVLAEIYKLCQ